MQVTRLLAVLGSMTLYLVLGTIAFAALLAFVTLQTFASTAGSHDGNGVSDRSDRAGPSGAAAGASTSAPAQTRAAKHHHEPQQRQDGYQRRTSNSYSLGDRRRARRQSIARDGARVNAHGRSRHQRPSSAHASAARHGRSQAGATGDSDNVEAPLLGAQQGDAGAQPGHSDQRGGESAAEQDDADVGSFAVNV